MRDKLPCTPGTRLAPRAMLSWTSDERSAVDHRIMQGAVPAELGTASRSEGAVMGWAGFGLACQGALQSRRSAVA